MSEKKIFYNRTTERRRRTLKLPDIPKSQWCDFRVEYESGKTFKEIAEKFLCDPRTVRRCLLKNKSSSALGSQTAPTKLAPYYERIEELYSEHKARPAFAKKKGICEMSKCITRELQTEGYEGGERTVRNYLRRKYELVKRPDDSQEE